jgi:peptide chain release factor subunit 1
MMQEHDLQELAEFVSEEAPILSLYIPLDRHARSTEEHKPALRRLLEAADSAGAPRADVERIERFFEHEYDRQGRSVACFSCEGGKFWRSYALLVQIPGTVFVGRRPYVKPLSDVWDNYERFAVVMVDREGARSFIYHLGALFDTAGTLGNEVKHHKQGGWSAQKLQRSEDQEARHNFKEAAEWAKGHLVSHNVKRVVLAGTEENVAEFRSQLPRGLSEIVVGQINLGMNATPAEAWERAYEVAQQAQRESEDALLDQVVTLAHKGGTGAIGLADTLIALQQGRVYQLLVDPSLHVPGQQCTNCQAVVLEVHDCCPYCGGTMTASADVVNLAVHRAIDAGLKVSALSGHSRLGQVGGIGAVLRY